MLFKTNILLSYRLKQVVSTQLKITDLLNIDILRYNRTATSQDETDDVNAA
jgi:hypothetical protein